MHSRSVSIHITPDWKNLLKYFNAQKFSVYNYLTPENFPYIILILIPRDTCHAYIWRLSQMPKAPQESGSQTQMTDNFLRRVVLVNLSLR